MPRHREVPRLLLACRAKREEAGWGLGLSSPLPTEWKVLAACRQLCTEPLKALPARGGVGLERRNQPYHSPRTEVALYLQFGCFVLGPEVFSVRGCGVVRISPGLPSLTLHSQHRPEPVVLRKAGGQGRWSFPTRYPTALGSPHRNTLKTISPGPER